MMNVVFNVYGKGPVKTYRVPRPGFEKNLPDKSLRPLFFSRKKKVFAPPFFSRKKSSPPIFSRKKSLPPFF